MMDIEFNLCVKEQKPDIKDDYREVKNERKK